MQEINWNLHQTLAKETVVFTNNIERNQRMNEMLKKYSDDVSVTITSTKGTNGEGIIAVFDVKVAEQIKTSTQQKKQSEKTFISEGGITFSEVSETIGTDTEADMFNVVDDSDVQIPKFFSETETTIVSSDEPIVRKIEDKPIVATVDIPSVKKEEPNEDLVYKRTVEDVPQNLTHEQRLSKQYLDELRADLSSRKDPVKKKGFFSRMKSFLSNVFNGKKPITDPSLMLEEGKPAATIKYSIPSDDYHPTMITPAERNALTNNTDFFKNIEETVPKEFSNKEVLYAGPKEHEVIEEQNKKKPFEPNIEDLYGRIF